MYTYIHVAMSSVQFSINGKIRSSKAVQVYVHVQYTVHTWGLAKTGLTVFRVRLRLSSQSSVAHTKLPRLAIIHFALPTLA
jgi:hypothetical protein